MLYSLTREQIEQFVCLNFPTSNNEAEYEAMIDGLNLALVLATAKVEIISDSQLVVGQIQYEYRTKDECMAYYLAMVHTRIPREGNGKTDALAEVTAVLPTNESIILLVYVKATFSIAPKQVNDIIQTDLGWMQSIIDYLHTGEVLEDRKQTHKLCIQATRFTLINNQLYRWSFGGPYLKCLTDLEAQYVLVELHEGIYDNHLRGRMLTHRAYSQGYYWTIMKSDAKSYVKKM